jgi:hypothetical protein
MVWYVLLRPLRPEQTGPKNVRVQLIELSYTQGFHFALLYSQVKKSFKLFVICSAAETRISHLPRLKLADRKAVALYVG